MTTMLLFLAVSFFGGIALAHKPVKYRWWLALGLSIYMCYAYLYGGAQF